jgi:uridine kinase
VKRVLRTAKSKRKEIDEMLDSIMKKAEDNSDKFLRERGAIKEVVVPDKKKSVLGKRKKLVVKEEEEIT